MRAHNNTRLQALFYIDKMVRTDVLHVIITYKNNQ